MLLKAAANGSVVQNPFIASTLTQAVHRYVQVVLTPPTSRFYGNKRADVGQRASAVSAKVCSTETHGHVKAATMSVTTPTFSSSLTSDLRRGRGTVARGSHGTTTVFTVRGAVFISIRSAQATR